MVVKNIFLMFFIFSSCSSTTSTVSSNEGSSKTSSTTSTTTTTTTTSVSSTEGIGLLITGGARTRSVELFDLNRNDGCQLEDLPDSREDHTQNGNILCGGYDADTCLTWTNGSWTVSHHFIHGRYYHTSWTTDSGVLLIGGGGSSTTTEMVTWQGTTEERFSLKYDSFGSCIIDEEGQSFLLTGGYYSKETVSRYDNNGHKEDLDGLNHGRWGHGCTRYTNNNGDKVNLVCGGFDGSEYRLDSCEENIAGTRHWTYTTSLPRALTYLRGVTLDNRVLMTGGYDGKIDRREILELVNGEWKQIATMKNARRGHAITEVNIEDYWGFCK